MEDLTEAQSEGRRLLHEMTEGIALNQRNPPPNYDPLELKRRMIGAIDRIQGAK